MYRAQILLKPEQRCRLEEIARREGCSVSVAIRQVIDIGLKALESKAERWEKRACILSELRAVWGKQSFETCGDLVNEARQEWEDEIERIWHGDM